MIANEGGSILAIAPLDPFFFRKRDKRCRTHGNVRLPAGLIGTVMAVGLGADQRSTAGTAGAQTVQSMRLIARVVSRGCSR